LTLPPGGADEDPELFLRDMHLGAEIGCEHTEPARQANRQRLQNGFLHPLAVPANPLHSSMMILIATRDSRSRWPRKSSRRIGPEGKAGFHAIGPV
jgi:hypothetical protein